MGHINFTLQIDTFLSKDSTSTSTSTLRAQKQPELLSLKRNITTITKPFNLTTNKKQKSNPMAPPRKVEYIRRKKTHNTEYTIKDTIIGVLPSKTATVFLPPVKKEDG